MHIIKLKIFGGAIIQEFLFCYLEMYTTRAFDAASFAEFPFSPFLERNNTRVTSDTSHFTRTTSKLALNKFFIVVNHSHTSFTTNS